MNGAVDNQFVEKRGPSKKFLLRHIRCNKKVDHKNID